MTLTFDTSIKYVKGVGEKRAQMFHKMGVDTVGDLLSMYPRHYEDWNSIIPIGCAPAGETVSIRATVVQETEEKMVRGGMKIYTVMVSDGISLMDITFFNNKWAANALKESKEYIFFGKVTLFGRSITMNNPRFVEVSDEPDNMKPVYPQTAGLNSKAIEAIVKNALDAVGIIEDPLPLSIRDANHLMDKDRAVRNMHFPQDDDMQKAAKRRLIFEELFLLQVGLSRLKMKQRKQTSVILKEDFTKDFISKLPFELTNAQKKAINESIADMSKSVPMNRLLQGDVGSGKTAVSAALIYSAVKNGFQCALMAPTEVLAQQHYATMCKFFSDEDIDIQLLTGSTPAKEKRNIKKLIGSGQCDLVIGTHALIQDDVSFSSLGLVVTDEQHRFGVNQRGALSSKGNNPHTLVMSATPIPRTLSLIIYGDLDLSILDELPAGRQKIETYLVNGDMRERVYGYVKKHLCEHRQGYIVCPLVEDDESEKENELKSATEIFKEFSDGFFKGFSLGLLYGKMKPADKKKVMDRFAAGEIDLLISTTVIEVGIDVPNAVIMVIENADRFGLSQLHQLRGRIGRGKYASTCIMISDNENEATADRLKVIKDTTDGFKIADEDLKLRGPGDFFGSRQHGLPDLKVADMMTDGELIRETNMAVTELLKSDPNLEGEEYTIMKKYVNNMFIKGLVMN